VEYILSVVPECHSGRVYVNASQYFANVPTEAWDFFIGGYQPARKWLKDRKGRTLSYDDIEHYRKIIAVLIETARIMKTIDDPAAQVADLKQKLHDLENQLHAQNKPQELKIIGGNVTFNDYSTNYTIKK
jgi:hypothetical protein